MATITTAEHSDDENEVDTLPADDGRETQLRRSYSEKQNKYKAINSPLLLE